MDVSRFAEGTSPVPGWAVSRVGVVFDDAEPGAVATLLPNVDEGVDWLPVQLLADLDEAPHWLVDEDADPDLDAAPGWLAEELMSDPGITPDWLVDVLPVTMTQPEAPSTDDLLALVAAACRVPAWWSCSRRWRSGS